MQYIICLFPKHNTVQFEIQVLISFQKHGKTALMLVAQGGHLEATRLLLKRKCRIRAIDVCKSFKRTTTHIKVDKAGFHLLNNNLTLIKFLHIKICLISDSSLYYYYHCNNES